MKKYELSDRWLVVMGIIAVLVLVVVVVLTEPRSPRPKPVDTNEPTEPDYLAVSQNFEFPPAKEFETSPFYSISWIEKGFLLVKAERDFSQRYGYIPYLTKAIMEVKKKKYTITATIPVRVSVCPHYANVARTDGLLLEVELKQ
ncbi:hypothetical protein AMJ47_00550 [Parcubacteria bacterium DG_72]|nr:MAG: hypothetical protein AMJ47_00550 [Parcubacteria bacterium DG_72]